MTKHNQGGEQARPTRAKKPYVKPAYQREDVFETMALSCGKVQTTEGQCHSNRKNS
ncbi:MAG TPA: hypothetical protein VNE82_16880 [Candidatus Binataceae bacterium]|nr:hypothetical protein [Candidatus Binataceae bacterium]